MGVETVGRSGQISAGKALIGHSFFVVKLWPDGDVLLKRAFVGPANAAWVNTPVITARLTAAREWADRTPR